MSSQMSICFAYLVDTNCYTICTIMGPKKLSQPVAICTKCGECSSRLDVINERCSKDHDGARCEGVFANALADRDWRECSKCSRTGRVLGDVCYQCTGWGWEFVRDKHWRRLGTIMTPKAR